MTRLRPFARAWCDPIYRLDVFVVCSKEADFQRALKPMLNRTSLRPHIGDVLEDTSSTSLDGCDGRTWTLIHGDQHFAVVWIKPGVDVSVLVHELWHVAFDRSSDFWSARALRTSRIPIAHFINQVR